MTLVDTSAWVEFLRATGSDTHAAVVGFLDRDTTAHTTDVVVMEVLAGARDNEHRDRLRRLLARCEHVPVRDRKKTTCAASTTPPLSQKAFRRPAAQVAFFSRP